MGTSPNSAPLDHDLPLTLDAQAKAGLDAELRTLRRAHEDGEPVLPRLVDLGSRLAGFVFCHDRLVPFAQALARAQREGRRLRLWLRPADAAGAAVMTLPWELLRLDDTMRQVVAGAGAVLERDEGFLALHPAIEIIRTPEAPGEPASGEGTPAAPARDRVHILLVCVDQPGRPWPFASRVKKEIDGIEQLLRARLAERAEVRRVDGIGALALVDLIEDFQPDILHFAGHGALPEEKGASLRSPALVLCGRDTNPEYLEADELARACVHARTRVVILNCCNLAAADVGDAEGASATDSESALSLAQRLSAEGVGLVVAMQLPVLDADAEMLAHWLYRPMLRGYAVSSAVSRHRFKYRETRQVHNPAWLAPVVYTRSRTTVVFSAPPESTGRHDFDELIHTYQIGFIGREWMFGKLAGYLDDPQRKVFLLSGPAGIGKSAILAACVHRYRERRAAASPTAYERAASGYEDTLAAFYRYGELSSPLDCARNLLGQLNLKLDTGQAATLEAQTQVAIDAVGEALRSRAPDRKLIIVIDGLDESRDPAEALPIPETLLGKLPENVAVIAAARPEWYERWRQRHPSPDAPGGIDADARFRHFAIDPLGTDNLGDAAALVGQQFRNADASETRDKCDELGRLAGGNFLVIGLLGEEFRRYMPRAAARGLFEEAAEATAGAAGISGLYRLYFDKHVAADPAYQDDMEPVRAVLGLLATAREELSDDQLAAGLAATVPRLREQAAAGVVRALRHLRRFLRTSEFQRWSDPTQIDVLYAPYHHSFATFAERETGVRRDPEARWPDLGDPGAHRYAVAWAEHCLRWSELDDYPRRYALRHLPTHLMLCGGEFEAQLTSTLLQYAYMAAAIGAKPGSPRPLMANELLVHYSEALDPQRKEARADRMRPLE